jgi:hypothetical protein
MHIIWRSGSEQCVFYCELTPPGSYIAITIQLFSHCALRSSSSSWAEFIV